MKKRSVIVLFTLSLISSMLFGCGSSDKKDDAMDILADKLIDESDKAEEEVKEEEEKVVKSDSEDIYKAFIDGKEKVFIDNKVCRSFDAEYLSFKDVYDTGDYTIDQVFDMMSDFVQADNEDISVNVDNKQYAFIDCGMDGDKELLVTAYVNMENEIFEMSMIIKEFDGKLNLCYGSDAWSRSHRTVNNAGFVFSEGSGGANVSVVEEGFVDENGDWHYLYGCESTTAPYSYYYDGEFYDLTNYNILVDNIVIFQFFFDHDYESREYMYSYAQLRDENAESDYYYAGLDRTPAMYEDGYLCYDTLVGIGLPIVSLDEIDLKIKERGDGFGFKEEYKEAGSPDFMTFN